MKITLILLAILISLVDSSCSNNRELREFERDRVKAVTKGILFILGGNAKSISKEKVEEYFQKHFKNGFAVKLETCFSEEHCKRADSNWVANQLKNDSDLLADALHLCFPNGNNGLDKKDLMKLMIPSSKADDAIKKHGYVESGLITIEGLVHYIYDLKAGRDYLI